MILSYFLLFVLNTLEPSLYWSGLFLYGIFVVKILYHRIPYISTRSPTIPKGKLRKIILQSEEGKISNTFRNCYMLVQSEFLVPYESMVIYVDKQQRKPNKGYLLTPQERQHSRIHSKYNKNVKYPNLLAEKLLSLYKKFFFSSTFFLKNNMSTIVTTIVAIHENRFYYDYTIKDMFQDIWNDEKYQDTKLLNKIILWHHYEELEHHMEAVHLFTKNYGIFRIILVLVTLPLYFIIMYIQHVFAFLLWSTEIFENPTSFGKNLIGVVYFNVKTIAATELTTLFSAFLIVFALSSQDSKIDSDLKEFEKRYYERYSIDLSLDNATHVF